MADDILPVAEATVENEQEQTTTELPTIPFKPIQLSKEKIDRLNQMFYDRPEGSSPVIAEALAGELQVENPNLLSYDSLRSGEAKLFDLLPSLRDLSPNERRLSDNEIIQLLATDEEGNEIQPGTWLGGFTREIMPQSAGFAGGLAGARAGYAMQAPIPATSPATVAVKAAIPIVTGTAGFLGLYEAGKVGTDFLLGDEAPVLPGTTAAYESGKTTAGALAWLPMPFLVGKNVNLGGAQLLDNIGTLRESKKLLSAGPPTKAQVDVAQEAAEQIATRTLKYADKEKGPRTARLVRGIENMLGGMRKISGEQPKTVIAGELAAAGGQTLAARAAEEQEPGGVGRRLGYEVAGAVTPQILMMGLAAKVPGLIPLVKGLANKEKLQEKMGELGVYRKTKAVNRILEVLEGSGEDIDEIIKRLSDPTVLLDEAGEPIKLTAGIKSGSPTLLAVERTLDNLGGDLAATRLAGSEKALTAYRNLLTLMVNTGDEDVLQVAADLMGDLFQQDMTRRMTTATDNLLSAVEKTKGEFVGTMDLSENLHTILQQQLSAARNQERQLWNAVGDVEITEFKTPDGEVSDVPNFVRVWDEIMPTNKEVRESFEKAFNVADRYVTRVRNGLDAGDEAADVVVDVAEPKLTKALEKKKADILSAGDDYISQQTRARFEWDANSLPADDQARKNIVGYLDNVLDMNSDDKAGFAYTQAKKLKQLVSKLPTEEQQAQKVAKAQEAAEAAKPEYVPITLKELQDQRSWALNEARKYSAQGESNMARMVSRYADAIMDDLNSLEGGPNVAYGVARAYSRALNDTFTRAFAGDALQSTKTGADKLIPELLGQRLMQGGSDPTYIRIDQIRNVGRFGIEQGFEGAQDAAASIDGTIEMLLRNARTKSVDPVTGEINVRQLQTWLRDNEELVNQFPALKADLEDLNTAQVLLNEERQAVKEASKQQRGIVTFQSLMTDNTESPVSAVAQSLSRGNKQPWKSMNNLLKVAEEAPEDMRDAAKNGLKSAVLEHAMTAAGGTSRTFKPSVMYRALFEPLENSTSSVNMAEWMIKHELMRPAELKNLRTYLGEMMRFEMAQAEGNLDEIIDTAGPLLDFYLRITGSNIGAKASGVIGGGGGDLIARSAGSKLLRKAFEEVPESMKTDLMAKMMEDPVLLATMMRRGKTDREKMNLSLRIGDYLTQMGFRVARRMIAPAGRETMREEEQVETFNERQQPKPIVRPAPIPAPQAQPMPMPQPMPAPAPAPAPVAAAPASPQSRAQYAALFPNDSASQMIKSQQGIASLMG